MKVCVTGASGHIGAHVVDQLLERGHQVRALVRKSSDLRGLRASEIELTHGDIRERAAVRRAAEGCEAIIHLAAVYRTIARTSEEIIEPAVSGAENIVRVAADLGIRRLVFTSSVASIGFSHDREQLRTADDWNDDARNPYYVAKTQSERRVLKLAAELGVELIVLCPTIVLGPGDYRITPSNQLIMDLLSGKGQTYNGGMNVIDVRDVARAHVEALTHGEAGSRFIVGGENIEVRELGRIIQELTGRKPLHLPFGRKMMLGSSRAVELLCRLLHIRPPFTHDLVYEVVGRYAWYDSTSTWQTLGFQPQDPPRVLRDCIAWLIDQGKIKQSLAQTFQNRLKQSPDTFEATRTFSEKNS